jgi:salicylate hydroxylase
MAVEDAYILAGLLTPDIIRSASDIKYALKAYDEVRRPRSQDIVRGSRRQGKRLELQYEDGSFLDVPFEELKTAVESYMAWVWGFEPAEMLEEAKRLVGSYKAVNGG